MSHRIGIRVGVTVLALSVAIALWMPVLHLFFQPSMSEYYSIRSEIPTRAKQIANHQLQSWTSPGKPSKEITRMRVTNPEWDFMARTFLVLSLANMSLRDTSSKAAYLTQMDRIIEETIDLERTHGPYFFLLDYAREGKFAADEPYSVFVDGEIALMIGARRLVEEDRIYDGMLKSRVDRLVATLNRGPVLCGESYPDECWMFCNAVALAAIKVSDVLDGTDHSPFLRDWIKTARAKLIDVESGMLFSSFTLSGTPIDGPEGSSIWMVAHCLQIVDPEFAKDQYRRAKRELGRKLLGFGYAREWPDCWQGPADVDSGPICTVSQCQCRVKRYGHARSECVWRQCIPAILDYFVKLCRFPDPKG